SLIARSLYQRQIADLLRDRFCSRTRAKEICFEPSLEPCTSLYADCRHAASLRCSAPWIRVLLRRCRSSEEGAAPAAEVPRAIQRRRTSQRARTSPHTR